MALYIIPGEHPLRWVYSGGLICRILFSGKRSAVRDPTAYIEPVSGHAVGGPLASDPLLRPASQRVLFRPQPAELRRHPLLLPERRQTQEAGQRTPRRFLGGDQVLRTRGTCNQQIQVRYHLRIATYLSSWGGLSTYHPTAQITAGYLNGIPSSVPDEPEYPLMGLLLGELFSKYT
ncbi:hypothetical protein AAG570_004340 [Ranatra chinensis]|uniref:Uncharacterized protein n=1 Tax=Ranatra chinensis TaxID=642074 RepID=A0ABD0Y1F3_9HEMI